MISSFEDNREKLYARSTRTLEALFILIDKLQYFSEEGTEDLNIREISSKTSKRLQYFKEYYYLLTRAFSVETIEQQNEIVKLCFEIPEEEKSRIDFNNFSKENFDAIDSFFISYARLKLEMVMEMIESKESYNKEEVKKDFFYIVE